MNIKKLIALLAFALTCLAVATVSTAQEKTAKRGKAKVVKVEKLTAQIKIGDAKPVTKSTDRATITVYDSPGTSCSKEGQKSSETRPPVTKNCTIEGRKVECICVSTYALTCDGTSYQTESISTTCTATEVVVVDSGSPLDKLFE